MITEPAQAIAYAYKVHDRRVPGRSCSSKRFSISNLVFTCRIKRDKYGRA